MQTATCCRRNRNCANGTGVSRITAKHALDLLREKGLVKRIRRRGTVVAAQDLFVRQTRGFVAVVFPHFENCGNRIYHG